MTSAKEIDCREVLGNDAWAAETCKRLDLNARSHEEMRKRSKGEQAEIDFERDQLLITKAGGRALTLDQMPIGRAGGRSSQDVLAEILAETSDLTERAMEEETESCAIDEALANGHDFATASRMGREARRGISVVSKGLRAARRILGLPELVNKAAQLERRDIPQAAGVPRFTNHWRATGYGRHMMTFEGRLAEVIPAMGGKRFTLVLMDRPQSPGHKPRKMLLNSNPSMTWPTEAAARYEAQVFMAAADFDIEANYLPEADLRALAQRSGGVSRDALVRRADKMCSHDFQTLMEDDPMALRDTIRRSVGIGTLVPNSYTQRTERARPATRLVPRSGPVRGDGGAAVRGADRLAVTARARFVEGVGFVPRLKDVMRVGVGLRPGFEPDARPTSSVAGAVTRSMAFSNPANEAGFGQQLQSPGYYDRLLDCFWQSEAAMASAHKVLDCAPGCRPFTSAEAIAATHDGRESNLSGFAQAAAHMQGLQRKNHKLVGLP